MAFGYVQSYNIYQNSVFQIFSDFTWTYLKIEDISEYTRHEHRQTPTIFYLKLWTFALLFFSLDMEFLGLLVCLWTFKWVGGPLVGDFGCAVFIVESTNPKNLD